ncbi:MAG TPA: hypothetical protein ENK43_11250 [Planctomycetes bacterium]|nr:hypothetical protein [Planctomycetota bacterium]
MGKQSAPDPAPQGAPLWIVTFTDMSSLLLTFFILLLTFSSMETEKLQQATGNFAGAFGAITEPGQRSRPDTDTNEARPFRKTDLNGVTDTSQRHDQVDELVKKIQDRKIFNVQITREDTVEGTRIHLVPPGNEEVFFLASDRLKPTSQRVLREIGKMFRTLPVRLVVETHIDTEMGRARRGVSPKDLTLSQALAAARVLQEAGMTPENVGAAPRGDLYPIDDNKTAEGRYKNRRLDILVIPFAKDEILKRAAGGL